MPRVWVALASLAGCGAVAMAAISAHAVQDPAAQRMVSSGVQMQGWHALALLAVALWARRGGWLAHLAAAAFVAGMVMFCGAVYTLGLAGVSLGLVAPTGGAILMLGWLLLGASALRAGAEGQ